jgi:hypothetical protein
MDREWLDAGSVARIRYDLKLLGRLKHINARSENKRMLKGTSAGVGVQPVHGYR